MSSETGPGFVALVNPAAGGGRCGRRADDALSALREAGVAAEAVRSEGPGHVRELAERAYLGGRRDFIAVGGDGTVHEALNGLFPAALSGPRPRLGFLPLGTGNSFLRDFGGRDGALAALREGRHRRCDVLQLTHDGGVLFFVNILSFGFAADIAALTARRYKRFGEVGYTLATISELVRLRTHLLPMRLDGGALRERPMIFVSFCNSRFTGGRMMMAPAADPADGELDVVIAHEMGRAAVLRALPRIFRGTHVDLPTVEALRAREVVFTETAEVEAMVDGEVVSLSPRRIDVLAGALDVYI